MSVLRFLIVLLAALAGLSAVLEPAREPVAAEPPLLPSEVVVAGPAEVRELVAAFGATFRWSAPADEAIWPRGLLVRAEDAGELLRVSVFRRGGAADRRPVWTGTFRRVAGPDGEAATAGVVARLLWARPEVAAAAVEAYLENQPDVARAGADLWRAGRWQAAADTLFSALEEDWAPETQAQLYFGLAESYARLGRPRQAYWYALAYAGSSGKEPPESWLRTLAGAATLSSEAGANVEPQAQELLRRRAAAERSGDAREALESLRRLCQIAPWADAYQLEMAAAYDRLGWRRLADAWKRRAALTRRLAGDEALQDRVAAQLR